MQRHNCVTNSENNFITCMCCCRSIWCGSSLFCVSRNTWVFAARVLSNWWSCLWICLSLCWALRATVLLPSPQTQQDRDRKVVERLNPEPYTLHQVSYTRHQQRWRLRLLCADCSTADESEQAGERLSFLSMIILQVKAAEIRENVWVRRRCCGYTNLYHSSSEVTAGWHDHSLTGNSAALKNILEATLEKLRLGQTR